MHFCYRNTNHIHTTQLFRIITKKKKEEKKQNKTRRGNKKFSTLNIIMDSTRVLQSPKHSTCLSSSATTKNCYNNCRKNTGGMYTIGNVNGGGGQILMNSHDINKATHLQFSPPARFKSTNIISSHSSPDKSNCLTTINDHNNGSNIYKTATTTMMCTGPACQNIGKSIIVDTMATKKLLSAVIRQQQNNCSTIMSTTFMAKFPTKTSLELIADDNAIFIEHSQHANYYQTKSTSIPSTANHKSNNFNGHHADDTLPNDGNKLINSIKSFFSAIIRPIMDTTNLIVGNDTKSEINSNGIGQTGIHTDFVSGNCCNFDGSTTNPKNIQFWHGNQMHCRHSPPNDMMMDNNVPFFDCDDFIEGGEDQVDFVADSTKFEWQQQQQQHTNHSSTERNFNDFMLDAVTARSLSKDNIFYDCMPTTGIDSPIKQQQQQQQQEHMPDKSVIIDESVRKPMAIAADSDNKTIEVACVTANHTDSNCLKWEIQTEIDNNRKIDDDNVQYEKKENVQKSKTKSTTITPNLDAVIPKNHSYRTHNNHKRINNNNNNNNNNNKKRTNNRSNYCHKNKSTNKNRHEKSRHELEMNIHDDIDEIFSNDLPNVSSKNSLFQSNHSRKANGIDDDGDNNDDDDDDADADANADTIDLEIIDLDTIRPTTSSALNIQSKPASELAESAEISTISPETISSGCIFTKFFRFDNNNKSCSDKPKSLPYRLAQKLMPQMRSMQTERNLSMCHATETESDDSFIVFEDYSPNNSIKNYCYSRQRHLSECSDDFITFERDDDYNDDHDDNDDDDDMDDDDTDGDDFTDSTTDNDADEMDDSDSESDNESGDYTQIFKKSPKDDFLKEPDSGFEEKKVSFNLCPKVHEIRAWKFAYSAARKGEWEQIYRDRKRFEKRTDELNRVIAPILTNEHRQKIYNERFKEPLLMQQ